MTLALWTFDSDAVLSEDRTHRYTLGRRLTAAENPRTFLSIGLNPSTADETVNDATITKEMGYARRLGFDRYEKGNLFSFRSTDPQGLLRVADPSGGARNLRALVEMARGAALVLAAWGGPYSPKALRDLVATQAGRVCAALAGAGITLHALALTKDGIPRHPLYLKSDLAPFVWRPASVAGEAVTVRPGDRVAQLVVVAAPRVELVEVEALGETERGEAGWGSTGL